MIPGPIVVGEATPGDRDAIDALRHRVYAEELGQYARSPTERLADAHPFSTVLCAKRGDALLGYIAITPPGSPRLRIDDYVERASLPFAIGPRTAEARQLTVDPRVRDSTIATRLLLACLAWLDARGVEDVVTIGHDAVVRMYERYGARKSGVRVRAGGMAYDVLHTRMEALRSARSHLRHIERLLAREDERSARCVHGGRVLAAAGPRLDRLDALDRAVDADVLDGWFGPSQRAVDALVAHAPRLMQTSPPADCEPLLAAIAERWNLPATNIALGAGSSDLIYRAFTSWLRPSSRVLVLDPTYAEYAHVVERVIGAKLTRCSARRADGYRVSFDRLRAELAEGYDLVVIVNPNNPTGVLLDRVALSEVLSLAPPSTRVWIDEAYVHFAGERASLLRFAADSKNVFVSRSFSKSLALSGLRAAFLVGPPDDVARLRRCTPPWMIGFPGQVAVLRALEDDAYYARRYEETESLRVDLAERLRSELSLDVLEGVIASVLVHLDARHPTAARVCSKTAREGVFLRDASSFGSGLGRSTLRISVKDRATNARVVKALRRAISERR